MNAREVKIRAAVKQMVDEVTTYEGIVAKLGELTYEQLIDLNKLVVQQARYKNRESGRVVAAKFHVGQKVSFYSRKKFKQVHCTIEAINSVNISAREDSTGARWTVSPRLLVEA